MKVTIVNFPDDDGGYYWDNQLEGLYPDVYFKVSIAGTSSVLYDAGSGSRKENLRLTDLPFSWAFTNGGSIYSSNNLYQGIDIDLYDYDIASADEYMGSATFNPIAYTTGSNKYPSTVTVTNGRVSIKLDLTWQ
jgi:hypothetical protein